MKKKKWQDMEVARIKLNPEQAVLACCDSSSKARQHTDTSPGQCVSLPYTYCNPAGTAFNSVSS